MGDTGIAWADKVWNPIVGCTPAGEGCRNCYAKRLHDQRHKAYHEGKRIPEQYRKPFETVQLLPERLDDPARWRKPQLVFVNSVSDLFHPDVKLDWLIRIFSVMARCERHTYVILTKRSTAMARLGCRWGTKRWRNVYLGVSICTQADADAAVPELRKLRDAGWKTVVSCEPLLESVDLGGFRPTWFVLGCESGANRRPCKLCWIEMLVTCNGYPKTFVKQLDLDGKCVTDPAKFPSNVRFRERLELLGLGVDVRGGEVK